MWWNNALSCIATSFDNLLSLQLNNHNWSDAVYWRDWLLSLRNQNDYLLGSRSCQPGTISGFLVSHITASRINTRETINSAKLSTNISTNNYGRNYPQQNKIINYRRYFDAQPPAAITHSNMWPRCDLDLDTSTFKTYAVHLLPQLHRQTVWWNSVHWFVRHRADARTHVLYENDRIPHSAEFLIFCLYNVGVRICLTLRTSAARSCDLPVTTRRVNALLSTAVLSSTILKSCKLCKVRLRLSFCFTVFFGEWRFVFYTANCVIFSHKMQLRFPPGPAGQEQSALLRLPSWMNGKIKGLDPQPPNDAADASRNHPAPPPPPPYIKQTARRRASRVYHGAPARQPDLTAASRKSDVSAAEGFKKDGGEEMGKVGKEKGGIGGEGDEKGIKRLKPHCEILRRPTGLVAYATASKTMRKFVLKKVHRKFLQVNNKLWCEAQQTPPPAAT